MLMNSFVCKTESLLFAHLFKTNSIAFIIFGSRWSAGASHFLHSPLFVKHYIEDITILTDVTGFLSSLSYSFHTYYSHVPWSTIPISSSFFGVIVWNLFLAPAWPTQTMVCIYFKCIVNYKFDGIVCMFLYMYM